MKVIPVILLILPFTLGEIRPPYPASGFRPSQPLIVPSVQTNQQLQSQRLSQTPVPHRVYGVPPENKNIESLDIQGLPRLAPAKYRLNNQRNFASSNQNIPSTSYGVPVTSSRQKNIRILSSITNQPQTAYGRPSNSNNFGASSSPVPQPQTEYGVPNNPNQVTKATTFSNNNFNGGSTDDQNSQDLPVFEASNFNQDFNAGGERNTPNTLDFGSNRKPNQYVPPQNNIPNNGIDLRFQNRPTPNNGFGDGSQDVPVVQGENTPEDNDGGDANQTDSPNDYVPPEDDNQNDAVNPNINFDRRPQRPNRFNTNFDQDQSTNNNNVNVNVPQNGYDVNTAYPDVYYPAPSTPSPSTTIRTVIRRRKPIRRPTSTTTEAPVDEGEEEAAESDNDGNVAKPNVAIANAFAGLYLPQQNGGFSRVPTQYAPAETVDCNQQYASAYQNLQTYQQPLYSLNVPFVPLWK